MRILVIGDLHCREIWKDIVAKEIDSCDKIIFLGDYTCPREIKLDDPTDACGFLYDVLDFKDRNSDKVILLRGNHDMNSLGYYWAYCYPQDHPKVREYWQTNDVKNWFLKNTQWIYRIPDTKIIFSHAGCSTVFLKNAEKYLANNMGFYNPFEETDNRYLWLIDELNYIEPCELFGFNGDYFDTVGESPQQPCTWIRPYTLLQYGVKDIIQVIGHTPCDNIVNLKEYCLKENKEQFEDKYLTKINDYCDIYTCDCLENKQYLIIKDEKFMVTKL